MNGPDDRDIERVAKVSKARRQHLLARLLAEHCVTSQEQLVELLLQDGISATQATVSRDLEEVGAVKVRVPGTDRLVYALAELPRDQLVPEEHLRRVLGEWVVDVASSSNLVVLHTPPGSAHVVASALDRSNLEGMLGTLAGDDTVLVVAGKGAAGKALFGRLEELTQR
ncbi:MAG: arginine repressor [Acidimicrobiales bacterium]